MRRIIYADNARALAELPKAFAELVYIDPPFNTGAKQARSRVRVVRDEDGDRAGFGGNRYRSEVVKSASYADSFDDYSAFLMPRIEAALSCLTPNGSLFVHLDSNEVHYVKVALDRLLGRECFMNEIVWAYDYGGRSKKKWPAKHDSILWYALDPKNYVYRYDDIDRVPYMAPGLVTPEKAARGKVPTDVWWQTIVPTNSREKTGYPTQKPLALIRRIVRVHSNPGGVVLDFFAGSGTTGEAAALEGRDFVLVDQSEEAVAVMKKRLAKYGAVVEKPLPKAKKTPRKAREKKA